MANDNNIKTFTAADIEKYHNGQLSAKEMHDLEKAALDDPFLADALEGYAITVTDVNADIAELKKRLTHKTEQAQAKVIPMIAGGRSSFRWLRAAVVVVLIAGAGLLSYQFLFNAGSNDNKIAQAPKETEKAKASDSLKTLPQTNNDDKSPESAITNKVSESNVATEPGTKEQEFIATDANGKSNVARDSITVNFDITATNAPSTSAPVKATEEKAEYYKFSDISKQKDDAAAGKADAFTKNENKSKELAFNKKAVDKDADGVVDVQDKATEVVVSGYATSKRSDNLYRNTNFFRGRVTDANNNALPFANITNTRDNVGTYSDAQGGFTLVSPDSVLNVQVKSLGFEINNVQLRNFAAENRVMMQEDRSLSARVLDTVKRNISRNRNNTMTFEEPEPADGWDSYGSYVVNNLKDIETFDIKKTGKTADNVVEVSFEVNKNGDPVNIKVEKSLCDKCDKEAIRLIKEGPKWKRKAKKGKRTTVAVPFIKTD